jgi:hypothetical protein
MSAVTIVILVVAGVVIRPVILAAVARQLVIGGVMARSFVLAAVSRHLVVSRPMD